MLQCIDYNLLDKLCISYVTYRLASPENRDAFGIIVSYAIKVKLFLGALGGELSAELPFVLMHPKVKSGRLSRTWID